MTTHMFQALPFIDLLNRLQTNDPSLSKSPYFDEYLLSGDDVTDDIITDFINIFPNETTPDVLRFKGPKRPSITFSVWQKFLNHLVLYQRKTKHLSFTNDLFCLESTRILANTFRNNNTIIRSLFLYDNHSMQIEGVIDLFEALQHNQVLVSLNLGGSIPCANASESERLSLGQSIRNFLQQNTTLNYLDLSRNDICPTIASEIAIGLQYNISLEDLTLEKNNIQDTGAGAIANALRYNQQILDIDLSENNIGDDGLTSFTELFRRNYNKSLIALNFSFNNDITDVGLRSLADALKYNVTLDHLLIQLHNVSSTNPAIPFLEALQYNSKLYFVGVVNTDVPIGDESMIQEKIKEMLEYNDTVSDIQTNPAPSEELNDIIDQNARLVPKKGGRIRTDTFIWLCTNWMYSNNHV